MTEIAQFLMDHYYSKYPTPGVSRETLQATIERFPESVVVVRDHGEIVGVGIYVSLTDQMIKELRITKAFSIEKLIEMLQTRGDHIHFLMMVADGYATIMCGLRAVINERRPRTVSWFEPDLSYFHQFSLN